MVPPTPACPCNSRRRAHWSCQSHEVALQKWRFSGCSIITVDCCAAGFRSTRRTKLICTIGPASCSEGVLESLASSGMNVARLNMCHGTHEWHLSVIERIRQLNKSKG